MVEQAMHLMRDAAPVLPLMKECLNEFYDKHPEADRDEASFFFQGGADALKNYLEISQWASHYNRDVKLRSEEHTSELQSLMRISYAVFCLKKKTRRNQHSKNII